MNSLLMSVCVAVTAGLTAAQAPRSDRPVALCGLAQLPPGVRTDVVSMRPPAGPRGLLLLSPVDLDAEQVAASIADWFGDGEAEPKARVLGPAGSAAGLSEALANADILWLLPAPKPASESGKDGEKRVGYGWLVEATKQPPLRDALAAFRDRGGIVGAQGSAVRWLGERRVQADVDGASQPALGWLRSCVVIEPGIEIEGRPARHRGMLVAQPRALIVDGRRMRAIGAMGGQLRFAGLSEQVRVLRINAASVIDLQRWRRAARQRGAASPDVKAPSAFEHSGTVLIAGGNRAPQNPGDQPALPEQVWKAFVEAARSDGDRPQRIALIHTGSGGDAEAIAARSQIEALGAGVIPVTLHQKAGRKPAGFVTMLQAVDGVWLCGRAPWELLDCVENGPIHDALLSVLERGGCIGGSGPVVAALGGTALRCAPLDDRITVAEGYAIGVGVAPGFLIEPHCDQRGYSEGLAELAARRAPEVALGIDEGMAVLLRGDNLEVVGNGGAVRIVRGGQPVPFALTPGENFDFVRWAPR